MYYLQDIKTGLYYVDHPIFHYVPESIIIGSFKRAKEFEYLHQAQTWRDEFNYSTLIHGCKFQVVYLKKDEE